MPRLVTRPAGDPRCDGEGLDTTIARIGARLAGSFQTLLSHLPGAPLRPQELARTVGMNKDFSSRIIKALEFRDPIAVAHAIPGPEPLRRLLKAAAERGIDDEVLDAAADAVAQFDALIRSMAGDRSGLDTIISAWLPEARERAELLSKQAVFKGMSQIRGCLIEAEAMARFVHPAADGDDHDYALLTSIVGLRRLRPGTAIECGDYDLRPSQERAPITTLSAGPVNTQNDMMLEQFCSSPPPHFDVADEDGVMHLTLAGDQVGLSSAVDLSWAFVKRSCRIRGVFNTVVIPAKRSVNDLFVHAEIAPRVPPALEIYDTAEKGIAQFHDPARNLDRLDLKASIDYLGQGASRFRCSVVPRYVEMIKYVCERMNWDPSAFHGYRCTIDYPVYGSQICMALDPSPAL